jgi:hypothetical protein
MFVRSEGRPALRGELSRGREGVPSKYLDHVEDLGHGREHEMDPVQLDFKTRPPFPRDGVRKRRIERVRVCPDLGV